MTAPANLGCGGPAGASAPTLILGRTAQLNIFPLGEYGVTPPAPAFPTPASVGGVMSSKAGLYHSRHRACRSPNIAGRGWQIGRAPD